MCPAAQLAYFRTVAPCAAVFGVERLDLSLGNRARAREWGLAPLDPTFAHFDNQTAVRVGAFLEGLKAQFDLSG